MLAHQIVYDSVFTVCDDNDLRVVAQVDTEEQAIEAAKLDLAMFPNGTRKRYSILKAVKKVEIDSSDLVAQVT